MLVRHAQQEIIKSTHLVASMTQLRAPQAFGALATGGTLARNERIPHHRAQAAKARGDPLEPIIGLGPVGLIFGMRRICTSLIPKVGDDDGHLSWAGHAQAARPSWPERQFFFI
jgi:hypothetical protein